MKITWQKASYYSTFGVFVVALIGVSYAIVQFEEAKQTTERLETLINKSSEQLTQISNQTNILQQAVVETARQTILEAYQNGLPYTIVPVNCDYSEGENKIKFRLEVFDNEEFPSLVKFEILTSIHYYSPKKTGGNNIYLYVGKQKLIYEPGIQKVSEVSLDRIFGDVENPVSELYVRAKYHYAPYFDTQDTVLTHYIEDEGHLLLGLYKGENSEKWNKITNNQNIVCK